MAILIKGMEMPIGCDDCLLKDGYGCSVKRWLILIKRDGGQTRPDWCPLVEVPKPNMVMSKEAMEAAGFES